MCWRVKFLFNVGWVVWYQSQIQVSTNLIHAYAEFLVIKMTWSDSFIIIEKNCKQDVSLTLRFF